MVDTSHLIKDKSDLFSTHLVACFIGQLRNMITDSSPTNILTRVYHEKTLLRPGMVKEMEILKGNRCHLSGDPAMANLLESSFYLIGERSVATLLGSLPFLVEPFSKRKIWFLQNNIYEYPVAVYYNPEKDPRIGREYAKETG